MLAILLKKQINEKLARLKTEKRNADIIGLILTVILAAAIIVVSVKVFSLFVEKYCAVRINNVSDALSRQFELIAIIYEVVLALGALGATAKLYNSVFESDDRNILIVLPISPSTIFASKIISIYLGQAVVTLCVTMPLVAVFASVTSQSGSFIFASIAAGLILPLFSILLASILCLPYFYVKKFFKTKYISLFITLTIIIGLCFWGYAKLLGAMESLLSTGAIRFVFSEKVMTTIIKTSNLLLPANLISRFILGISPLKNFGLIVAVALLSGAAATAIIYLLYENAIKLRAETSGKVLFARKVLAPYRNINISLLLREISALFYTPDYAVQYFSVAAIMPLMVYCCQKVGTNLLTYAVAADGGFELALFITLLFGALINTFCATNVSRDGKAFCVQKTMPISYKAIIKSKIILSFAVSALSTLISVVVLMSLKYTNVGEGIFIFVVGAMLGFAQICFATRKDLNRPHFSDEDDGVVKNTNGNVSSVTAAGLIGAAVIGGVPLCVSVALGLKGQSAALFPYLFSGLLAAAAVVAACFFAFYKIEDSFNRVAEVSENEK